MSGPRSETHDNLLLIAATAIAVLTLQRYFQRSPVPAEPRLAPNPSPDTLTGELSRPAHGRLSNNPFQIPWTG
jgi:membrane protein